MAQFLFIDGYILSSMNLDKFYGKAYNWLISFGPKLLLALVIFITGLWLIKKLSKL